MINLVWLFLIIFGIAMAAVTGKVALISETIFSSARAAIEFTFGLAGLIAFWSGILKIAEASGITETLAKVFQPFLAKIFPDIPKNHKVLGLISMTVTANLFGLGNVATPLGLKAMENLQELSPDPDRASDSICVFLTLIFGGLTLVPATLIAVRAQAGSENPGLVILPIFLITVFGALIGLVTNFLFIKTSRKRNK
jgi:spore maturation protein A